MVLGLEPAVTDATRLERARHDLQALCDNPDPLERHLTVAAILTELLQGTGLRPVVVGGSAVEFYTAGLYMTADLDLVVSGLNATAEVLRDLGFVQSGALFRHADVPVVVDLPQEPLAGDPGRVVEVTINGRRAYVIGIDDIILDRLAAYQHGRDEASLEWAVQLMVAQWERVDWSYVEEQARQQRIDRVVVSKA
ncbi:MAG TPA: hypothetical protein VF282_09715, partial [Bacillota bacterium]